MNNPDTIYDNPIFPDSGINRINTFTGCDMTVDTLYIDSSVSQDYISNNNHDSCLFFFKGFGKCYLKNTSESMIDVSEGSVVYIPRGVSYKIVNSNTPMIAVETSSSITHS